MKQIEAEFTLLSVQECAAVMGGVDSNAKNALYYIGYVVGLIVKGLKALKDRVAGWVNPE